MADLKIPKSLLRKLEKLRDRVSADRDKLRDFMSDIEDQAAIDRLSELA